MLTKIRFGLKQTLSRVSSALLVFGLFILSPQTLFAQAGLVPCEGTGCDTCHFIAMGNSIVMWLIGILFVLFAVMLVAAGFALVTSRGNSGDKETAKRRLLNAVVGLIIVLAGWLIVDTLLRSMLGSGGALSNGRIVTTGRLWNDVECGFQYRPELVVQQLYTDVTLSPTACDPAPPPSGPQTDCTRLVNQCSGSGGTPTVDTSNPSVHTVACTSSAGATTTTSSYTLQLRGGGTVPLASCGGAQLRTINFLGGSVTVQENLVASLQDINNAWLALGGQGFYRVTSVGGYNCRNTASGGRSWHAYGLAVDINPAQNPYGPTLITDMPPAFVALFTSRGWGWGGNWNSVKDAMHFSKGGNEGGDMTGD